MGVSAWIGPVHGLWMYSRGPVMMAGNGSIGLVRGGHVGRLRPRAGGVATQTIAPVVSLVCDIYNDMWCAAAAQDN